MADAPQQTTTSPVAAAVEAVKEQQVPSTETKEAQPQPDPKLDAYAKKERAYRAKIREMEQKLASMDTDYKSNYIPKSKLTEDPLSVLNESGITYDKLTELLLNSPSSNDPAYKALRNEIQTLKDSIAQQQKQTQDQTTAQYQQALKQIKSEVSQLVTTSADFETIKEMNMADAVVELIEQTFNSDGYLMDIEEAAKEVESHLVEEALRYAKLGKVQSRLAPKPPEAPVSAPKTEQKPQTPIKTITNAVGQEKPKRSSEKERRERALAAFYGKNS